MVCFQVAALAEGSYGTAVVRNCAKKTMAGGKEKWMAPTAVDRIVPRKQWRATVVTTFTLDLYLIP